MKGKGLPSWRFRKIECWGFVYWKIKLSEIPNVESIRVAKSTEYFKLVEDSQQTIGITHHQKGLGKLKVFDKETNTEYGIPISDILNKSLKDWGIEKK